MLTVATFDDGFDLNVPVDVPTRLRSSAFLVFDHVEACESPDLPGDDP